MDNTIAIVVGLTGKGTRVNKTPGQDFSRQAV